jgi:hypothetical protein
MMVVIIGLRLLSLNFGWATPETQEIAHLPRPIGRRNDHDGQGEQP